jgi:hypothetical protein
LLRPGRVLLEQPFVEGFVETFLAERFQQVINGVGIKSAHGVLIEGRGENNRWGLIE